MEMENLSVLLQNMYVDTADWFDENRGYLGLGVVGVALIYSMLPITLKPEYIIATRLKGMFRRSELEDKFDDEFK